MAYTACGISTHETLLTLRNRRVSFYARSARGRGDVAQIPESPPQKARAPAGTRFERACEDDRPRPRVRLRPRGQRPLLEAAGVLARARLPSNPSRTCTCGTGPAPIWRGMNGTLGNKNKVSPPLTRSPRRSPRAPARARFRPGQNGFSRLFSHYAGKKNRQITRRYSYPTVAARPVIA